MAHHGRFPDGAPPMTMAVSGPAEPSPTELKALTYCVSRSAVFDQTRSLLRCQSVNLELAWHALGLGLRMQRGTQSVEQKRGPGSPTDAGDRMHLVVKRAMRFSRRD